MRRLIVAVSMLALLMLAPAGCKRRRTVRANPAEDDGQLATVVNVADPRAAVQLSRGFHGIENDSWRWAAKNFAVILRRPTGALPNGATLQLKFTVPDVVFNRLGAMTLKAGINGVALPPETYSKAGDFMYVRDVPASALSGETVPVEFAVDKAIPPGDVDARELAIIVSTVGLTPK